MAVVITSKFYQEDEWKDISKVVFTSPNMVSPSVVGTRSHILPGEGDLGMWYEDTSMMYRVEEAQEIALTDFYDFAMYASYETTLSGITEIFVDHPSYKGIDNYIQERSGVEPIGYSNVTVYLKEATARLEYTLLQQGLNKITSTTGNEIETILEQQSRQCLTILSSTPINCHEVFNSNTFQAVSAGGALSGGSIGTWTTRGGCWYLPEGAIYFAPKDCSDRASLFTTSDEGGGGSTSINPYLNTGGTVYNSPAAGGSGFTTQVCDDYIYEISSSEHPLFKSSIFKTEGWSTEVIAGLENCYLTFEFYEPIRITAVQMDSMKYKTSELTLPDDDEDRQNKAPLRGKNNFVAATKGNITVTVPHQQDNSFTTYDVSSEEENRDLDENIYGTGCSRIRALDETIEEEKRYFVGNIEIQASTDADTWITIGTHSNDDKNDATIYLNNGQYFQYYRINILNNNSLDSSKFNRDFYGITSLKFFSYQFSEDAGTEPIALYDFSDVEDPIILKVANATAEEGPEETDGETTEMPLDGEAWVTTYSGTYGVASKYDIYLGNSPDLDAYVLAATPLATTISGLGIDATADSYLPEYEVVVESYCEAQYAAISGSPGRYTIEVNADASYVLPVDTVDWTGRYELDYFTIASGTNTTSGSPKYILDGTITRVKESFLKRKDQYYRLQVEESSHSEGSIPLGTELNLWGFIDRPLGLDSLNSVVFQVTTGEAYNCRLTAWDDVTHSTLFNELLVGEHARASVAAFCCGDGILSPSETKDPINMIRPPVHNLILKGNTVYQGQKYFYGDFDMVYRYQDDVFGDYLMFKPYLIGIHSGISYGVHDFIVTLHYSYT
jgi:hypothetical protein